MEKVDHPPHYNQGEIEVIDAIEDWNLDFHLGNAVKYIARAGHKGDAKTDIEKAIWYLRRYLDQPVEGGCKTCGRPVSEHGALGRC